MRKHNAARLRDQRTAVFGRGASGIFGLPDRAKGEDMAANPELPTDPAFRFDAEQYEMEPFLGEESVKFAIVDIDADHGTVDLVVKFGPNSMAPNHRHVAAFSSLVLEGSHHVYEVDENGNTTTDVRPAGTYRRSASGGVHKEGGGPEGAVVWFNLRPDADGLYEILQDDGTLLDAFGVKRLLEETGAA